MATGLGKTVTVAFDAKRHFAQNGKKLLYLCHMTDILYQARSEFEAIVDGGKRFGFLHGKEKDLHEVDCLFSTFQTMNNWLDMFDPTEFDYVVVDESHHSGAETYLRPLQYFRPTFLLGITATPERGDDKDIREIYGPAIFNLPLEKALANGYLTPVDYRILTDEIYTAGIPEIEGQQYSFAALNRKVFIPKRDEEIVKLIAHHVSGIEKPKIIVFCSSVRHCDHLAAFMPDSLPIHSRIPGKERDVRLEMFRQDLLNTVITRDCFNEGIDVPRANVIVFLRSTTSHNIFLQQLGRGLRKTDGKDKVVVLDFVGNLERIRVVQDLSRTAEEETKKRTARSASFNHHSSPPPITLQIGSVRFEDRVVPFDELLARIVPKTVSEVPELSKEYSDQNEVAAHIQPANSNRAVRWSCSVCGHEWICSPRGRVRNLKSCPGCNGEVATVKNNLSITHPDIAREYSTMNEAPVQEVLADTHMVLFWTCLSCGKEWRARGRTRVYADPGCPDCGYKVGDRNSETIAARKIRLELANEKLTKEEALRRLSDPAMQMVGNLQRAVDSAPYKKVIKRTDKDSSPTPNLFKTWQEAGRVAISMGISTSREYEAKFRGYPQLPASPHQVYRDFPGWDVFLDTKPYDTWQEASEVVTELKISNRQDYGQRYHEDRRLPSNPRNTWSDFPGWKIFLGPSARKYDTWQEACVAIKHWKTRTMSYYHSNYWRNPKLPRNPDAKYQDFPGWPVFLGKA